MSGSSLPPVQLRLQLENKTKESIEIEILEINSDLGNFAVRPEKLNIAAGETEEPDPMRSQLGVTSVEIPVKVGLRLSGTRETQTITLRPVRTASAPSQTQ